MVTLSKFQTAFMKFEMAQAFPFIKWLLQSFEEMKRFLEFFHEEHQCNIKRFVEEKQRFISVANCNLNF